ncbi:hypothetical protein U9M48_010181 [Paspalum notatum var. saurae]|uniref:Uncharacterized protein n=1 Tax=Paspalum notatum var. saurae TaxID=547442 RepID=A0AAQ3ST01_PASNO
MGFIMEFAENLILRLMEDPDKRDQVRREHVYKMKERCERTKAAWSLPLRPYGFWTFERFNSQLSWDPQISQAAGRRDPYDDLITRHSGSPPVYGMLYWHESCKTAGPPDHRLISLWPRFSVCQVKAMYSIVFRRHHDGLVMSR